MSSTSITADYPNFFDILPGLTTEKSDDSVFDTALFDTNSVIVSANNANLKKNFIQGVQLITEKFPLCIILDRKNQLKNSS